MDGMSIAASKTPLPIPRPLPDQCQSGGKTLPFRSRAISAIPAITAVPYPLPLLAFHPISPHSHPRSPHSTPGLRRLLPHLTPKSEDGLSRGCDLLPASFSQRPHPPITFVENKDQSPIRKAFQKAVEAFFLRFSGLQSDSISALFSRSNCSVGRGSQILKLPRTPHGFG